MNQKKSVINCMRATQTTNDDDMDQEELQKPAKDHKYCHCRNHEANERESSNPYTYTRIGNNTRVQPQRRRKTGPLSIEKIAEIITINLSDQRMDFFVVLFFSSATEVSQRNFFASTPFIGNPFNLLQTSKK